MDEGHQAPDLQRIRGFSVEPNDKEVAVHQMNKRRWIWLVMSVLFFSGALQTASAWDVIPRDESVRKATDEFQQAWRIEAERKFSEPRLIDANHLASALLLAILIASLGALFHLMVRSNHMEQTANKVRSGMLAFYTRMWLISRWGFRY